MVVVAQLVRALVCGTRGRGFESHLPPLEQPDDESHPVFFVSNTPANSIAVQYCLSEFHLKHLPLKNGLYNV